MSVDLCHQIVEANQDPATYVTSPKYVGSIQFEVGVARAVQLRVGCEPIPDNPYHGEVWGAHKPNKFTKSQQRAILSAATWLVALPEVEIVAA